MNIIKSNCFPLYYIFFFKLLQRCCQQRSDRQNYSRISFNNCSIINKKPDETGVSSLKLLIVKNSLYQFVSRNCRNYWSLAGNIWKLKSFRESPSFTLPPRPIFLGTKQNRLLAPVDPRGKGSAVCWSVKSAFVNRAGRKRFGSSKNPSNLENVHIVEWKEFLTSNEFYSFDHSLPLLRYLWYRLSRTSIDVPINFPKVSNFLLHESARRPCHRRKKLIFTVDRLYTWPETLVPWRDGRYNSKGLELGQRRMSLGMKIGIGVARSRKSILYDTAKFGWFIT